MSEHIPWLEYRKELATKGISVNKENVCLGMQSGKSGKNKNNEKKKGLFISVENCAVGIPSIRKSPDKVQFQVYCDDNDENVRSRSRMRKDVCRKELRARKNKKSIEKTFSTKVSKEEKDINPSLHVVSRRAFSSNKFQVNSKFSQRSCSESRVLSSQYAYAATAPTNPQNKNLSEDVKKRTFSSIQMWKDKMRKPHTGTVPKNFTSIHSNVLRIDEANVKKKLQKNSTTDCNKSLYRRFNISSNNTFDAEISQNQTNNPHKNIEGPELTTDYWKVQSFSTKQYLSSVDATRQNTSILNTHVDVNASTITPLDGFPALPLTPMKENLINFVSNYRYCCVRVVHALEMRTVRYEKREKNEKDDSPNNIHQLILCEYDYFEDLPETERSREERAPRVSSRFLLGNVNREQRKVIIKYLIHLSVHCNYSSHIIYQTVKLFDVVIGRIFIEVDNIQLMALACLWITLKREATEHKIPSATAILQLAKDLYIDQEKNLIMYEKKILLAVKFNIRFADPFSLLLYYIWSVNLHCRYKISPNKIIRLYYCGSYLIDVSMLDESLCDISECVLAMAAAELSLHFVCPSDINTAQPRQSWAIYRLFTEWEERTIISVKESMMQHVLKSDRDREFGSNIIYKKYLRSKNGKISNFFIGEIKKAILGEDAKKFFKC